MQYTHVDVKPLATYLNDNLCVHGYFKNIRKLAI